MKQDIWPAQAYCWALTGRALCSISLHKNSWLQARIDNANSLQKRKLICCISLRANQLDLLHNHLRQDPDQVICESLLIALGMALLSCCTFTHVCCKSQGSSLCRPERSTARKCIWAAWSKSTRSRQRLAKQGIARSCFTAWAVAYKHTYNDSVYWNQSCRTSSRSTRNCSCSPDQSFSAEHSLYFLNANRIKSSSSVKVFSVCYCVEPLAGARLHIHKCSETPNELFLGFWKLSSIN